MQLPTYGLIGLLAIVILLVVGTIIIRVEKLNVFDGYVLGAYGLLGAICGSKIMYVTQNIKNLFDNSQMKIQDFVKAGGTAYGGILLGLLFVYAGGVIHKINSEKYLESALFLLPICHGVWKLGCHFSGCCYGIPYTGVGSILLLTNSHGPIGVSIFPVQIFESILLFIVAGFMFYFRKRKACSSCQYIFIYSILRFCIEFLRNDDVKRYVGYLSDIQWFCLLTVVIMIASSITRRKRIDERTI